MKHVIYLLTTPFRYLYLLIIRPLKPRNLVNFYYAIFKFRSYRLLACNDLSVRHNDNGKRVRHLKYLYQQGTIFPHPLGIVIGHDVVIGANCTIYQNVTMGSRGHHGYPTLEDNVVVCAGAVIIGPITVGKNSIVAPNSVVIKDVPENVAVSGNPAKILKHLD